MGTNDLSYDSSIYWKPKETGCTGKGGPSVQTKAHDQIKWIGGGGEAVEFGEECL